MASNTGVPMLRPGTQAAAEGGPAAEPAAAGDTSSWLVDPETLLLVEDDAGDALLVEELIADSGVTASLTWVRSLAEARTGSAPARPRAASCWTCTCPTRWAGGGPPGHRGRPGRAGGRAHRAGRGGRRAGRGGGRRPGLPDQGPVGAGCVPPRDPLRRPAQARRAGRRGPADQRAAAEENARLERGLLPSPLLRTEGPSRWSPVTGRAGPMSLLGGDFYDVVETDGRHRARGDRRRVRARRGRGRDRGLPAGGLAVAGAGRAAAPQPTIELLEQVLVAERDGDHVFATLTHLVFRPGPAPRSRPAGRAPGAAAAHAGATVDLVGREGGPALGLFPGLSWETEEHLPCPPGREPGAVYRRAVRGPDRAGQRAARRGRPAGYGPAAGRAAVRGLRRHAASTRPRQTARDYGGLADDVAVVHLRLGAQRSERIRSASRPAPVHRA